MFKTKSNVIGIVIYAIVIIHFFSCGEKKSSCVFHDIHPKLIRAASIKEGSYFVYRDSIAGTLDSFETYRYAIDSFCNTSTGASAWYVAYYIRNQSDFNIDFKSGMESGKSMAGYFEYFGPVRYLYFPFQVNTELGSIAPIDTLYSYQLINQYAIWTIRNQEYVDVYEIISRRLSADKTDTAYIHTFYSTESGLIKYRSRRNKNEDWKVWELERSNIIR